MRIRRRLWEGPPGPRGALTSREAAHNAEQSSKQHFEAKARRGLGTSRIGESPSPTRVGEDLADRTARSPPEDTQLDSARFRCTIQAANL